MEAGEYVGTLPKTDPLYAFLKDDVLKEVLGLPEPDPVFEVHALHPDALAMRYTERHSGVEIVCKFYGNKLPAGDDDPGPEYFRARMWDEFNKMRKVWELGFDAPPYRIVRPLAVCEDIHYVIAEEYISGPMLDAFLKAAAEQQRHAPLYDRLTDLAGFLARLHTRSETGRQVAAQDGIDYFSKVIGQLAEKEVISSQERKRLERLRDRWDRKGVLGAAAEVTLHGDATPINFVFCDHGEVVAIDLERVGPGDAMKDVGCVAAEVHHAFYRTTGDPDAGRPFVRHFLDAYAERRSSSRKDLETMDARVRFWTGVTELRICRNDWLDLDYRQRLLMKAEETLDHED